MYASVYSTLRLATKIILKAEIKHLVFANGTIICKLLSFAFANDYQTTKHLVYANGTIMACLRYG